MKYVIGLLAIALGAFMVIKTEVFVRSFGRMGWAEKYLGTSGGTRLGYNLIGIVIIVIALLGMTGLLGNIILGIFAPLLGQ